MSGSKGGRIGCGVYWSFFFFLFRENSVTFNEKEYPIKDVKER
jgi:hypothetical protein